METARIHNTGFTLVELLVSIGVLSLILVMLAELTSQTRRVATQVTKRVETMRETRTAMEAMARRISQATLNSYWGYNNPSSPSTWMRQSELHFTTVWSDEMLTTNTEPATGHGVFFQAPFGYAGSEADSNGDDRLDYLDGLLNGWGYYIEFNSDLPDRTPFLRQQQILYPERKRFRLMELRIPSEELTVMTPPASDPNGLPVIAQKTNAKDINDWFADPAIRKKYARPISENVLALIISPVKPDKSTPGGNTSLAPNYKYDSRLFQYNGATSRAKTSRHQLPELLNITLIATDEGTWITYEDRHKEKSAKRILKELNSRFQDATNYEKDLKELNQWLLEEQLEPRVFRLSVPLRGAKFSTNFDV
ncbi:MAG: Verru_Chthon cassette protein C [Verrucomicrobiales bacterium]|nr:Verru_Chthon cassette protein C [Verrucomicrobiales bacterium]